jgi:predicted alpha/beta superfamily hydrolase
VIYMQDGQNVFDKATSFSGEWGVDETLDRLHASGDEGCIVIAVDNGGRTRNAEYHPINPDTGRPGEADKYLAYLIDTLKPAVDATFRTKPEPENTIIMGASSGASLSLYAALKRPDVFGRAGLFSTPLWVEPRFDQMARTANAARATSRLYFCTGAKETVGTFPAGKFAADMPAMIAGLEAGGFKKDSQFKVTLPEDGQHNEAFWAREFEGAYRFLTST